jgi:uncharacterized protein YciI
MEFLVLAYDGTDEGALARRMAAREAHLAGVRPMGEDGRMLIGGAILDDAGRMIGSMTVVNLPDRAAVDAWLADDPYVKGGVWQRIEVVPFRTGVRAGATG